MQAILVKTFGPSANRGARIKAIAGAGSITVSRHDLIEGIDLDSISLDKATLLVAQKLAKKFGWIGTYYGGTLPNGDRVFVSAESYDCFELTETRHEHDEQCKYMGFDLWNCGANDNSEPD